MHEPLTAEQIEARDASRFKRTFAIDIEFDTPIDFAEQDRLACVVLERLVDEYWRDAAADKAIKLGNIPTKAIAYRIETPRH